MLRIYVFWYEGLAEPLKIEAHSRLQAKEKLIDNLPNLPEPYRYTPIINETIETLVSGVSQRIQGGQKLIFIHGRGWVPVTDQQINDK